MSFFETRFPTRISYELVGSAGFNTSVIECASGFRKSNSEWDESLYTFKAHVPSKGSPEWREFLSFFLAIAQGQANQFRFYYMPDSTLVDELNTERPLMEAIDSTHFQLVKRYQYGLGHYTRTVTKPVMGSVKLYYPDENRVIQSGYTMDSTTGIATFTEAPGFTPRANCVFDIPCMLGGDSMDLARIAPDVMQWKSVTIQEVRI